MDLNADGRIDILSGSYSRRGTADMAGLFHVLWGQEDGGFAPAEVLDGTDGEPLILTSEQTTDVICTRAFAADLDADGKLDLVTGNFTGSFAWFRGEGEGRFQPAASWIMAGEERLVVEAHSDPFLVDWDGDGDLDLLSGAAKGGVTLMTNSGSKSEAKFEKPVALIAAPERRQSGLGDAARTGPGQSTRVWADDLDGDGKLDLLVGDSVHVMHPAEGLDLETALTRYAAWEKRFEEVDAAMRGEPKDGEEVDTAKLQARMYEIFEEQDSIVRHESLGYVWVFYQQ